MDRITVDRMEPDRGHWYCRKLEEGNVLYFPEIPFQIPPEDLSFLLRQQQSGASYHKNIAYRPAQDRITGLARQSGEDAARLLQIMRGYTPRVTEFLKSLLSPYAGSWHLDFASFRPEEEEGRNLRLRARNDLLHVDSFPSRPTRGDRILRVFMNVHPSRPRRWITTETFDVLILKFAGSHFPLPESLEQSTWKRARYRLMQAFQFLGLPLAPRPPYDEFMLRFHHFLKENQEFQQECPKQTWEFAPGSTWIVFTDMVPHAVLSGQYALEQTYIVSRHSLVLPEKAPINILEALAGAPLA